MDKTDLDLEDSAGNIGQDKYEMFANRLRKVYKMLRKRARKEGVTCYKVYDLDMPEFPLKIEWYEGRLHISEYQRNHKLDPYEHQVWLLRCIQKCAEVFEVTIDHIFIKERKPQKGSEQYEKVAKLQADFIVEEAGLKFRVNLSDYLDTGLFLDHRITRRLVQTLSRGKRVLNLFAYTGSFSVYAAAGGADMVATVDMSNTYISWAQENMALNGFVDDEKYFYMTEDVLSLLPELQPAYFDLIILDPPTFSNSKRMKHVFDIQRSHVQLLNQCIDCLAEGGLMIFSTNYRKFRMAEAEIQASSIEDITDKTTPFDFESKLHRMCYLIQK